MVAQNIAFGILAVVMVVAAFRLVTTKNVVHAALYLVSCSPASAGQFILLAAEFLAVVQVLVYIGAIVVLFLFGIMLTRAPIGRTPTSTTTSAGWRPWSPSSCSGALGAVLVDAFGDAEARVRSAVQRPADVGDSIFGPYVIPFEVVSVLLLAALVGAVVIARRD